MLEKKKGGGGEELTVSFIFVFLVRERERLLSKFLGDPTVGILRAKKESCSTRSGQRVDSGFEEFRQTP